MTLTPSMVREALAEHLKTALPPVVSVYTGLVPTRVPTYQDGTIKPYVGLWVSNSTGDPASETLDALADVDAVRLNVQTQIVAATEKDVYETADLVTAALTNHLIGAHPVKPDTDQHQNAYIMREAGTGDLTPYLPLLWRLETQ